MPTNKPARSLAVVVLAAGKGKRLKSKLPKVLHPVCGRPALWHVLQAARKARPKRIVIVVHHGADQVAEAVRSWNITPEPVFVEQGEPLGTGHAVMVTKDQVDDCSDVMVLAGDDPLIEGDHVKELLATHRRTRSAAAIITTRADRPTGYGRVIRVGHQLVEIVEESDAGEDIRGIDEISTLFYVFRREDLFLALPLVGTHNRQKEYYLPDTLPILNHEQKKVSVVECDMGGWSGLNDRAGVARVSAIMRERINARLMDEGVTIVDPAQTYIDVEVKIGEDTVVRPLTFLEGTTRIGEGCEIGPSARIVAGRIDDGAEVTFSVVRESRIGPGATVGPYASIRPGTVLDAGAKVGTFVEVKASRIGPDAKVPHLSYVGDARIGKNANVGAGTITVNYDGYEKHPTVVGDDARVGSDTMLVAPVKIGKGAATGAGSAITRDVPAGALGVERSDQRNVPGYRSRKDAEHDRGVRAAKAASTAKAASKKRGTTRKKQSKGERGN
ncbi:MAG: bifunctional UDP-N-acetylglucosamine diphosphorylase/glucosamine-1-phosphate N-acetyltransferase GlmU [Actinomycetota bacterium]